MADPVGFTKGDARIFKRIQKRREKREAIATVRRARIEAEYGSERSRTTSGPSSFSGAAKRTGKPVGLPTKPKPRFPTPPSRRAQ